MQSGAIFRSRNLRAYNDRQQGEKSKLLQTSSSFKSHLRSTSCVRNESSLYKSALVFNNKDPSQSLLHEFNIDSKREIASLTKIMTCFTALDFIRAQGIVPEELECEVSREAAELNGTSAGLEEGDVVSLWDLMFGLMLPSGNDAALCIAENIGKLMMGSHRERDDRSPRKLKRREDLKRVTRFQSRPVAIFVQQMNRNAEVLKMGNTQYSNPHGLPDHQNYSTSKDQLTLIQECLKHKLFRRIVKTKLYFGCVRTKGEVWTREIIWENTNKLLSKGYLGIKTGNTSPAGYCLASWYCTPESDLIIIVLGCPTRQERDFHTLRLTKEITSKLQCK